MLYRALMTLTHVASQLLYRWLPPPQRGAPLIHAEASELVGEVPTASWAALLADERCRQPRRLIWLESYLQHMDPNGERLVAAVQEHLAWLRASGGHYVVWGDAAYPALLKHLADPPLALSLLGDLAILKRPAVSIVGSRKASAFAARASYELGQLLASRGMAVVSGGAFGCDIAAHHGVMATRQVPAPAVCVFAGGLARLYPQANQGLFAKMRSARALLVSERLWFAPCRPMDFTARNRLISGLAPLTAVMQASQRSGALVTARLALDQGRDVGVLRHPASDIRASGSEALLRDGAWGFSSALDFLERANLSAASLDYRGREAEQGAQPSALPVATGLSTCYAERNSVDARNNR